MLRTLVPFFCLLSFASSSQAHFIWLDLVRGEQGADSGQVRVYFSETPAPGEPHLVSRAAATKVWARGADGKAAEIKLAKSDNEQLPALVAAAQTSKPLSLEAVCDYGVYERGGPGVLLQYYAKYLDRDWKSQGDQTSRSDRLALDVVPKLNGEKLELQVLYQKKPLAAAEVVVVDNKGHEESLTTDVNGVANLKAVPGRCALRASHVEKERSGERDGKKYSQTWHYCTVIFDVPTGESAAGKSPEISAAEALVRARAARSIWDNFPGFSADMIVTSDSGPVTGKLVIDRDGNVSLEMVKSPLADWVEEQLQTLVQHRMPDGEVTEGTITYAERDDVHPLGRKIDLGDPTSQSVYRIKDDVIMEVNRNAGKMRFTISVLEITRNLENKYLPRSFTMNFFDAASGELKTSLAYFNDWQRVGTFDLPKTILETGAHRGGAHTRQISFNNCRLLGEAIQAKTAVSR